MAAQFYGTNRMAKPILKQITLTRPPTRFPILLLSILFQNNLPSFKTCILTLPDVCFTSFKTQGPKRKAQNTGFEMQASNRALQDTNSNKLQDPLQDSPCKMHVVPSLAQASRCSNMVPRLPQKPSNQNVTRKVCAAHHLLNHGRDPPRLRAMQCNPPLRLGKPRHRHYMFRDIGNCTCGIGLHLPAMVRSS